jgi:polyhydroxyalkanoate synthesis repressor PhaR
MLVVKKYGNRRLYDTSESRYITLEELAGKLRLGTDVRIVDAKTGKDLTQATLTQVILESRGASKLLPVPLLIQLIRMGDGALAEFFGQFLGTALEMYLQAQQNARAISGYNPFASMSFGAPPAFPGIFNSAVWPRAANPSGVPQGAAPMGPMPGHEGNEPPVSEPESQPAPDEVAELRRELAEIKQSLKRKRSKG